MRTRTRLSEAFPAFFAGAAFTTVFRTGVAGAALAAVFRTGFAAVALDFVAMA
jgi:hypothetical protein